MPTIMPVTDLRNYGEVLRKVAPGKPVFLTRNGRGRYAVVDIDDWDCIEAARMLVDELDRGRASATEDTRSLAEARAHLAEMVTNAQA
ncbi:MAG: type II toxin-antitoxin system prevent-host-death family antitoxin [Atopobiaceae bacterium]|nr:type II toxin-antitoxin system prevent-host-death family antitoxin [Atopobiaceae bacterium]